MQRVIHQEQAAMDRLAQMGLNVEDVHAALKAGQGEAASWSEAAPRVMPGMARWGRINEHLRIRTGRKGWTYENPGGLPLTISPTGEIGIVATTGDVQTGSSTGPAPTTKYAKGATYQKVVEDNEQLPLFFVEPEVGAKLHDAADAPRATWILLYSVTSRGIAVELSLPGKITEQGYVSWWRERILIPAFIFEDVSLGHEQREDGQGFDVAVERR
ncbi:hypothetical protein [Nonomuraea harbinensis]|uniref:Uncharacterized protein n=1 Tax=Nonomuraea harbinensis TaxID=1286938 RepID=A0ABW1C5Q1_9ACTN|nr:hypothetical protein [Nonomuraea harbinensis]